jgi:hypothetical protein
MNSIIRWGTEHRALTTLLRALTTLLRWGTVLRALTTLRLRLD